MWLFFQVVHWTHLYHQGYPSQQFILIQWTDPAVMTTEEQDLYTAKDLKTADTINISSPWKVIFSVCFLLRVVRFRVCTLFLDVCALYVFVWELIWLVNSLHVCDGACCCTWHNVQICEGTIIAVQHLKVLRQHMLPSGLYCFQERRTSHIQNYSNWPINCSLKKWWCNTAVNMPVLLFFCWFCFFR